MSKLNHIISVLSDHLLCQSVAPNRPINPTCVLILDNQTSLKSQCIYIGSSKKVKLALENIPIEPYTIIIACGAKESDDFTPLIKKRNFMFIATTDSTSHIHNKLANVLSEYQRWNEKFQDIQLNQGSVEEILDMIYKIGKCSTAIFDQNFKSIAKAGPQCKELDDLVKLGNANYTIQQIHKKKPHNLLIEEILCVNESMYIALKINREKNIDYSTILEIAIKYIQRMVIMNKPYEKKQSAIESIFSDILNGKITDSEEIRKKLNECSSVTKEHFSIALVELTNKNAIIPYNYAIEQINKLIPASQSFIINNRIVIIMYHSSRLQYFPFNRKEMDELLFNLNAWMGVSNTMRNYSMMPTAYDMAEVVLTLPRKLHLERQNRCFIHSDYSIYHTIDKFAKEFIHEYGHNRMLYMAHPAIIILTRYDADNHTNLRDVLFYYLINNKSLIKTAKATYMHRNTIVKKLTKIKELVDVDLNDGYIQQNLLFSCQLLRYSEYIFNDNALIKK